MWVVAGARRLSSGDALEASSTDRDEASNLQPWKRVGLNPHRSAAGKQKPVHTDDACWHRGTCQHGLTPLIGSSRAHLPASTAVTRPARLGPSKGHFRVSISYKITPSAQLSSSGVSCVCVCVCVLGGWGGVSASVLRQWEEFASQRHYTSASLPYFSPLISSGLM